LAPVNNAQEFAATDATNIVKTMAAACRRSDGPDTVPNAAPVENSSVVERR
jgi:hypothetical protein